MLCRRISRPRNPTLLCSACWFLWACSVFRSCPCRRRIQSRSHAFPTLPILYHRRQLPVVVPYNQVAISRESVTSSSMYNSILSYVLPFSTNLYMTALKPTHLPSSGLFETSTFPRLLVYAGCVTSLVHAASPSPYSWALYALPRHLLFGRLCGNTAARAHLTRSRSLRTLLSRR
jgi:hypothetical protein